MSVLTQDTILVIDDNEMTLTLISAILRPLGCNLQVAKSGEEGLRRFFETRPDLVLLDIVLPGLDGYETCQRLLALADVPIIFLSANSDDDEVVRGLELGAVDYVIKPFSAKILLARVKLALRRYSSVSRQTANPVYDDGNLRIDSHSRRVAVEGNHIKLTATEYTLLLYLFEHAGSVLTFTQILDHVWGWDAMDRANVYTYVRRLRRKLEPRADSPSYISVEHSIGYRFEKRA